MEKHSVNFTSTFIKDRTKFNLNKGIEEENYEEHITNKNLDSCSFHSKSLRELQIPQCNL